ncbi:recombinase family protein [Aggregicoccus sp. 17bor-14]|nr:recombinase family protein [Aggregicoccus sp. 17bor-14]
MGRGLAHSVPVGGTGLSGTKRAALYLRVSTDRQATGNQSVDLHQLAAARGFTPVVYEETESAAKARPVFERMLADVRAGRIQAVLVWALDRLHRSMPGAINTVLELDHLGVPVMSVREPRLDTTGPVRSLLVAIFGWVAEQERTRLIERTRAGLARARAQGKRLGRPRASQFSLASAAALVTSQGWSIRKAAAEWKVGASTLGEYLRAGCTENPTLGGTSRTT